MPNRIIREGILSSERVNALDWEGEVFYRRLLSVVDDFGRFSADARLLRAAMYPLKLDTVRETNIERLISQCEKARLIVSYEVSTKRYLQVLDFNQQVRAKDSKYPHPPDIRAALATQASGERKAPAHLDVSVVEGDISTEAKASVVPLVLVGTDNNLTPTKPLSSEESNTRETWDAYSKAYEVRHGIAPIRNRTVNSQMADFVKRVPLAEAPFIAAFYVRSNKAYYVSQKHPVGALKKDAETLRTEWATGRQGTDTEARQADRTQANGNVFTKLIQEANDAEQATA